MALKIIVSATREETRMALVEEDRLIEYLVERETGSHLVGSIFWGRVANVAPGIQAVFVDIGLKQNAFLYVGEAKDLTEGASVLVQIVKDARGTKGPTASREITLAGRYVVLLPTANYVGVSHKLSSGEQRDHLYELGKKVCPKGMGLVVRTVAGDVTDEAVVEDIHNLTAQWRVLEARRKVSKAPAFLHRELDLAVRIVRDYFNKETRELLVDNRETYNRILDLLGELPGETLAKVKLYEGGEDIFRACGLGDALDSISDRRVDLPCGGYLVIDKTEAMTVIDVNSGSNSGKTSLEETSLETNREAAVEIAHQLRLRDIGGIIVADFIDMHTEDHKKEILQLLTESFQGDKMRPKVQDITVLNLVEITRKKSRQNLASVLYTPCPTCQGSGMVQAPETIAVEIKRRLRGLLKKQGSAKDILLVAHPLLAEYLKTSQLHAWSRELSCSLKVEADPSLHVEAFMILDNS
jgi:ribonuclease G